MPAPLREFVLGSWTAELVGPAGTVRTGRLVLTDHECAFVPAPRRLRRARDASDAELRWSLEEVRSFSVRRFFLPIGYGDRVELAGIELNGHQFRLGRETRAQDVLDAIQAARGRRPGSASTGSAARAR